MDEVGKALAEMVRTGAPLADSAIRWYFIVRLIESTMAYLVGGSLVAILGWAVYQSMMRWREWMKIEYGNRLEKP